MMFRGRVGLAKSVVLALASLGLGACNQSNEGGGVGGTSSSRSSSNAGGNAGGGGGSAGAASTVGSSASGGIAAAGGTVASGGTKGSGGVQSVGGTAGSSSGATKNSGGSSTSGTAGAGGGTGGASGNAGSSDSGGKSQTGGGLGGSAAGGGGTSSIRTGGTGGTSNSVGTAGTGGTTSSGGTGGSGGRTGNGGSITCPTPALKAGDTNKTVKVGSDSRSYVLHIPAGYDGSKAVPLVVDFHGLTGSGSQEESTTLYKPLTDADGVVSAYPTGKSGPMGAGWNVGPCCVADVDDVAFAKALVADVEKVACIDAKRVYAVGFSMGGGMTHYLACHAADVFAAAAPAAFDLLEENVAGCTPSRPITVIAFRSHGDTFVDYNGARSTYVASMPITFLGAKATFAKWAQIDQCTGTPSAEDSNGCSTYSSCGDGVQVTLCSKAGGTHEQGTASIGWPLLKKYTLP
jgi:polyhydroxybutyrate depolymerase